MSRSASHRSAKSSETPSRPAPRILLALIGSLLGTLLIAGPFIYQALT